MSLSSLDSSIGGDKTTSHKEGEEENVALAQSPPASVQGPQIPDPEMLQGSQPSRVLLFDYEKMAVAIIEMMSKVSQ